MILGSNIETGCIFRYDDNISVSTLMQSNESAFYTPGLSEAERNAEDLELSNLCKTQVEFDWKGVHCKKIYSNWEMTLLQTDVIPHRDGISSVFMYNRFDISSLDIFRFKFNHPLWGSEDRFFSEMSQERNLSTSKLILHPGITVEISQLQQAELGDVLEFSQDISMKVRPPIGYYYTASVNIGKAIFRAKIVYNRNRRLIIYGFLEEYRGVDPTEDAPHIILDEKVLTQTKISLVSFDISF